MKSNNDVLEMSLDEYIATRKDDFQLGNYYSNWQKCRVPRFSVQNRLKQQQQPYVCPNCNGNDRRLKQGYNGSGGNVGITDDNPTLAALPTLATKLLDFPQVPKQQTIANKLKFDMEIQKIIHDMQGKPLRYICGSGNIVSSDGAGIADCCVTPDTTGISLNCRFS